MIFRIPLEIIDDNRYQTRQVYDDVPELAARIQAEYDSHPETLGLLQVPLARLVGPDGEGYRFLVTTDDVDELREQVQALVDQGYRVELAFGHRRKRAFEYLATTDDPHYAAGEMPLMLSNMTDEQMLDAVWSENRDRRDISAVEEAELLLAKLQRPDGNGVKRSQRDVAEAWGLARSTVANRLRILDAPAGIKDCNRRGELSERQVLALITVDKLAKAVNGDVAWGKDPDPRNKRMWDWTPPSPVEFLEWTVTEGHDITSDEIREYTKDALKHAGQPLPDGIATTEVTFEDAGIPLKPDEPRPLLVQPSCRGCEYRIHETCLQAACLDTKKWLYGRRLAIEASEELELPFSADDDDFVRFVGYSEAQRLQDLVEAGGCEHLVVGWRPEGYAARPFSDTTHVSGYDHEAYRHGKGRAGVAIGHVGPVTAECWPELGDEADEAPEPPHPLEIGRQAWQEATREQLEAAQEKAKEALAEKFHHTVSYEAAETLLQLLAGRHYKPDWPADELGQKLVDYTFGRGQFWGWQESSDPIIGIEALERLCETANLPHVLVDERAAEAQALRVLAAWADNRRHDWRIEREAAEAEEPVAAALARLEEEAPESELLEPLRLANEEIAEILATEACEACGDELDPADIVRCSCGHNVCEACYAEGGHDQHDTNPENQWLIDALLGE